KALEHHPMCNCKDVVIKEILTIGQPDQDEYESWRHPDLSHVRPGLRITAGKVRQACFWLSHWRRPRRSTRATDCGKRAPGARAAAAHSRLVRVHLSRLTVVHSIAKSSAEQVRTQPETDNERRCYHDVSRTPHEQSDPDVLPMQLTDEFKGADP